MATKRCGLDIFHVLPPPPSKVSESAIVFENKVLEEGNIGSRNLGVEGGGARNMKDKLPYLASIFLWLLFMTGGMALATPQPPHPHPRTRFVLINTSDNEMQDQFM